MGPVTQSRLLTAEQFAALEDSRRWCELEGGRVVRSTPPGFEHGTVGIELGSTLREFARRNDLGRVSGLDVGLVVKRNPDTVRGADVVFISWSRLPKGVRVQGFLEVPPELVVEVFSPSDRWSKTEEKVREYHDFGVDLVWVLDPHTRTVRVFPRGAEPRTLQRGDTLDAEPHLPGLRIPVDAIFGA